MAPKIGAPAPAFKAQAVVDGQFKSVALEDFKVVWRGRRFVRLSCDSDRFDDGSFPSFRSSACPAARVVFLFCAPLLCGLDPPY